MTFSEIASLGELISGIAVLISLIYLAVQVRQAKVNQQLAIRQARADRMVDMLTTATEPTFALAYTMGFAGREDMTLTQVVQFMYGFMAWFRNAENFYYQHEDGLLDERAYQAFVVELKGALLSPGIQVMWRRYHSSFGVEFVEFIDGLLSELPPREIKDSLELWKSDLARLKSDFAKQTADPAEIDS